MLPSGLRVVTEDMPTSHSASLGFYIDVGSRHESDRLHGASHFLEHVLFKGTPSRSAEEISATVEAVGGDLNAYTAKEHTCFHARVMAEDLGVAVDVLTDMMVNSTVAAAEVEAERDVILDEIAMHADDPGEVAAEALTGYLFGGSDLGKSVIGTEESIASLSRSQVVGYWKRHYRPSAIVVSASGRVDHDQLIDQLGAFVSSAPMHRRRVPATKVCRGDGAVLHHHRPLEQCTATLGFRGVGVFDEERYAQGLLSVILGGGMASRLFVEVRERRGLAYTIEAGETSYSDTGLWSIDWQCAPDKLAEILTVVRAELEAVAEHGVTDEELTRAKGQLRGQTLLAYEGPSMRMSRLGNTELLGDDRDLGEVLDRFDDLSGQDLQQAAHRLASQSQVLSVVGPRVPRRRLERILGLG